MKQLFFSCFLLAAFYLPKAQKIRPLYTQDKEQLTTTDYLVNPVATKAEVYTTADKKNIILYNGLVKRSFRITPNVACIEYKNMVSGQQLLRAVMPEAYITINGIKCNIGGLYGQTEKAYLLPEWIDNFTAHDSDFQFVNYKVDNNIKPLLNWNSSKTWAMNKKMPTGKTLMFIYESKLAAWQGIQVVVKYELYDGLPLIEKSLDIVNNQDKNIVINQLTNEVLATVEEQSAVIGSIADMAKQQGIYVETNYAFNNSMRYDLSDQTKHWKADPSYTSQVNYNYTTPCILEVYPDNVRNVEMKPKETLNSVRSYELLMDSYDRERRALAIKNMYNTIAPWTTANPIFMHLVSQNDEEVYKAIDQCAATGYEAVILSFGSHCDLEDSSVANIKKWKKLADYAHSKNILIGGYSLLSSRRISDEDDVIDPVTGKPDKAAAFGNAPCLGSKWGLAYLDKIKYFLKNTGFNLFENDGPYPGDLCASTTHPGHKDLDDSQWKQMLLQKDLYNWCNENGVYVNAPDWYFLDGSNKIAIGYREVNFSLPRDHQMILNRQNIFDGLWEKTGSMSWGFVPLTRYQGGGEEAVLEPLSEHLKDYEQLMMQYYGAGVQACYRGPRLYDTDKTKQTVSNTVNWYKKYRDILNSSLVHLRRADGRDWDGWMHVNSQLATKGLMMLYNPLKEPITRTITVPMYYTDLTNSVTIKDKNGVAKKVVLNKKDELIFTFTLAAESYSWWTME